MKNYLKYKSEISIFKNVSDTLKVTEKISASSIHLLNKRVVNLNLYATQVEAILSRLSVFYKNPNNILLRARNGRRKALVIITGDKGLVGGLWHKMVDQFLKYRSEYEIIIAVGGKGDSYLKEENVSIEKSFPTPINLGREDGISNITNYIFDLFKNESISKIDILYPHFLSLSQQEPKLVHFLPFTFSLSGEKEKTGWPIFEPNRKKIFNSLLQKYIDVSFYKIVVESKLSEFSARTIETERASDKIEQFIKRLRITYLKERHRFITQEQLASFFVHKIL